MQRIVIDFAQPLEPFNLTPEQWAGLHMYLSIGHDMEVDNDMATLEHRFVVDNHNDPTHNLFQGNSAPVIFETILYPGPNGPLMIGDVLLTKKLAWREVGGERGWEEE